MQSSFVNKERAKFGDTLKIIDMQKRRYKTGKYLLMKELIKK
jgi:hypothetical protein